MDKIYYITEERVEEVTYAVLANSEQQAKAKFWETCPEQNSKPFTESRVVDTCIVGSKILPAVCDFYFNNRGELVKGKDELAKHYGYKNNYL